MPDTMVLQRFFVLLCAVARRARAAVAFVTPANTANAAPAAVALLRVRRFVPSSSGFFVVARPSTITSLRASHLRRFFDGDGPLDTLAVDVTRTEMLVALARLRSSAQMKSFLRGAPWPLEMFFWAVAPQKLADRGFEHTVALDADVFAMDGQIIDVLPTVRGIGIVRIFPKECYTAAMPASKARLPAFVPPLVDAVKIAAAPHAFAHRDGTNSGVIVFNNSRMVAVETACAVDRAACAGMSGIARIRSARTIRRLVRAPLARSLMAWAQVVAEKRMRESMTHKTRLAWYARSSLRVLKRLERLDTWLALRAWVVTTAHLRSLDDMCLRAMTRVVANATDRTLSRGWATWVTRTSRARVTTALLHTWARQHMAMVMRIWATAARDASRRACFAARKSPNYAWVAWVRAAGGAIGSCDVHLSLIHISEPTRPY
mgnify:CR=1 FL=1